MLELLISILLTLGISADTVDGKIAVNQEVLQKAKESSSYKDLGGDDKLNAISTPDDVDPNK